MNKRKLSALFIPAILVVILDQVSKWFIRSTPEYQNYTVIEGWLEFYFVKNDGMAMGIDILPTPVISVIAILATTGIIIYLLRSLKEASVGYLILMGLIVGGALGNISDRIFMGILYGYGGVLDGHVVDFIHFNLRIKDWAVFPYIFNVADIAISVSIISLLVFGKSLLLPHEAEVAESTLPSETPEDDPSVTHPSAPADTTTPK